MELPELPESPSDETDTESTSDSDKRSFYQQLQVVTTFVTLIVAVTAITLSIWEGYETRLSNRLAVQPYLEGQSQLITDDSTYTYTVFVTSDGLGPAVYKKVLIYDLQADSASGPIASTSASAPNLSMFDAEGIQERWTRANLPRQGFFGYFREGTMQRPGNEETFFNYSVDISDVDTDTTRAPHFRAREVAETYSIVICYCSVYGDSCGQTHVLGTPPSRTICADLGYEE